MGSGVAQIHSYPLRPEGYEEPLFPTRASRRAVAEHLLEAPWLWRASEMEGAGGQAPHARREAVRVERRADRVRVVRSSGGAWVAEVMERWREVGGWWDEGRAVDRVVVRALLSDGAVVDLAREGGGWFVVGVFD